jgi:microcystin-dependent protein
MSKYAWLTPSASEVAEYHATRSLCVAWPLLKFIGGAIRLLTESYRWEQDGDLTPEEAADVFKEVFDQWMVGEMAYIGQISAFCNSVLPSCWLGMGQSVNVADYPALANIVPLDWIQSGKINLPAMVARSLVGHESGGDYELGQSGGAERHTLIESEMPRHRHDYLRHVTGLVTVGAEPPVTVSSAGTAIGTSLTGNNGSHNNMPPFLAVVWAIYAGK